MTHSSDSNRSKIFLGLINYYRRFLKGYVKIARPLTDLISGENADKKKALVVWTSVCHEAFDQLKKLCTEAPVLAYPDFTNLSSFISMPVTKA